MAEKASPLASLSLTHVSYNPNDHLSYFCAFLALVPQALIVCYVTLLYSSREIEIALLFVGQLLNEAANYILKRTIKEERPVYLQHGREEDRSYGMPSSHAQFMFFFATYLGLFVLRRHLPTASVKPITITTSGSGSGSSPHHFHNAAYYLSFFGLCGAGAVAASRVYLGYHSTRQVLVGSTFGVLLGSAWYAVVGWARMTRLVEWVLELDMVRYLRARDLIVMEDMQDAGWFRWEQLRRKKLVKD